MISTPIPAVLLLHSSASSSRQWLALSAQLQPHHRVIAVDLHGHGRQDAWRGDSPLRLDDDAALALAQMPPEGAHVVGHSYGGAVALKLATLAPQAVHSLAVYEPVLASWLVDDDAQSLAAREFLSTGDFVDRALARGEPELAAWHFTDYWGGAGTWHAMPPDRRQAVARRMPAVCAHFGALLGERLSPTTVASLTMPMLCLHGDTTRASTRRVAQLLQAVLPHARHEALPGMGHLGPITHAAEVSAVVQAFIEQRLPAMPLLLAALAMA